MYTHLYTLTVKCILQLSLFFCKLPSPHHTTPHHTTPHHPSFPTPHQPPLLLPSHHITPPPSLTPYHPSSFLTPPHPPISLPNHTHTFVCNVIDILGTCKTSRDKGTYEAETLEVKPNSPTIVPQKDTITIHYSYILYMYSTYVSLCCDIRTCVRACTRTYTPSSSCLIRTVGEVTRTLPGPLQLLMNTHRLGLEMEGRSCHCGGPQGTVVSTWTSVANLWSYSVEPHCYVVDNWQIILMSINSN